MGVAAPSGLTAAAIYEALGIFGDGSDGNVTVNAESFTGGAGLIVDGKLTRDAHVGTLTLDGGDLDPNGYIVYAAVAIALLNGDIAAPVVSAEHAVGDTPASEPSTTPDGPLGGFRKGPGGASPNAGDVGSQGTPAEHAHFSGRATYTGPGAGGAAGANAGGAEPGVYDDPPQRGSYPRTMLHGYAWVAQAGIDDDGGPLNQHLELLGRAASGSSGGSSADGTGGAGGTAGAGGGVVVVLARRISGAGNVSARGGNGGNGGNGTGTTEAGGGGGGGGGAGGFVLLATNDQSGWTGEVDVSGGTGGSGGTGANDGEDGEDGADGPDGRALVFDLSA